MSGTGVAVASPTLPVANPAAQPSGMPAGAAAFDNEPDRHSTPVSHTSDDPDEVSLAAARAEVAAEEGGTPAPTQQTPAATPNPQQQQPAPTQRQAAPIMIPKGRLDEALRANEALKAEVTYLQGAAAARAAMATQPPAGTAPAVVAPATITPQQFIAEHQARIEAAAMQFDQGEITMAQFVKVQAEANGQIAAAREQALLAQMPRSTIQPGIADAHIMAQQVQELEAAHPWSKVLSNQELTFLTNLARQEAIGLGKPIGTGPIETMRLRKSVAELTSVYGPRWYPHRTAQVGVTLPTPQQQQQNQPNPPPASPQAQAGQRKLAIAAAHPPNINQVGAGGNSTELITAEQVAAMTTDEIEALPPQVRQRILAG